MIVKIRECNGQIYKYGNTSGLNVSSEALQEFVSRIESLDADIFFDTISCRVHWSSSNVILAFKNITPSYTLKVFPKKVLLFTELNLFKPKSILTITIKNDTSNK